MGGHFWVGDIHAASACRGGWPLLTELLCRMELRSWPVCKVATLVLGQSAGWTSTGRKTKSQSFCPRWRSPLSLTPTPTPDILGSCFLGCWLGVSSQFLCLITEGGSTQGEITEFLPPSHWRSGNPWVTGPSERDSGAVEQDQRQESHSGSSTPTSICYMTCEPRPGLGGQQAHWPQGRVGRVLWL